MGRFEEYLKTICHKLSPPEDPGCACGELKGHEGRHKCADVNCTVEWDEWDETGFNWNTYGFK